MFAEQELTTDEFLGGQLKIAQPSKGYRAGIDPVLLAAAAPARAGACVLELGCGVGTASLCLARRVPGLSIAGIELQRDYAALARRNAAENGLDLEVVDGDIAQMPRSLRQRSFDLVIANPPYFHRRAGTRAADAGRETALAETTPLSVWLDAATRRLSPNGRLVLVFRAERLPELLSALDARLGSNEVLPLAPRHGRPAKLLILRATKGGRAAFRLLSPTILHHGDHRAGDADDYTAEVQAVLRDGASLPWPAR